MLRGHPRQNRAGVAFQNTDAVDPAPLDLDEIPNIHKPEVMPIVRAIRQVAWLVTWPPARRGHCATGRGPRGMRRLIAMARPTVASLGRSGPYCVFQEPMEPKAPRPRILLLQIQHLFEKRERQLVVGMGRGACPLVLQAFKPIPLKGRNDRIHMRTCHLETASNALFVPSFVPHPDDGPAGLIGIRKLGKDQADCNSSCTGMA